MSYFSFGYVSLARQSGMDEAAWELVRSAQQAKLYVACGANIVQRPVREMLATRVEAAEYGISFFVTGGPLQDTSDSLISPYAVGHGSDGVLRGVRRIESWFRLFANVLQPKRIRLLMTEGYDDSFQHIQLGSLSLAAALEAAIRRDDDVPSTDVVIEAPFSSA